MTSSIIDKQGYRLNIGIVLVNSHGRVLLARRVGSLDAWQFPQGGMLAKETPEEAMYRELEEELGLTAIDVRCLAETKNWLSYELPKEFRRYNTRPLCIGQKQKWFLIKLLSGDDRIQLDTIEKPEFDQWRWVDYWYPLEHVVEFKRAVYRQVLEEFRSTVIDREANA